MEQREITLGEIIERDKPTKCVKCGKECEVTVESVPFGDKKGGCSAVLYHFDCKDCGKYSPVSADDCENMFVSV